MWYHVKVLRIRQNLFAGTEMLSLSVYEPITINILLGGTIPKFGGKGGVRSRFWYPRKPIKMGIIYLFKPLRNLASFKSKTPGKFWGWGGDPKIKGRGRAKGQKWSHSKV